MASTTTSPTTSTAATTTTPPVLFAIDWADPFAPPAPQEGSDGAFGTGCSPGVDRLPDGSWAGWATHRGADAIEFDLACVRPATGDPEISNQNSRIRSVPVSPLAVVYPITDEGSFGRLINLDYPTWQSSPTGAFCASMLIAPGLPDGCPVWIFVNDGAITEVMEFLPWRPSVS